MPGRTFKIDPVDREKRMQLVKEFYNKHGPRWVRWDQGHNPNRHMTSFNMTSRDLDMIELLILFGLYIDRSDAIRTWIRAGIQKDLDTILKIKNLEVDDDVNR